MAPIGEEPRSSSVFASPYLAIAEAATASLSSRSLIKERPESDPISSGDRYERRDRDVRFRLLPCGLDTLKVVRVNADTFRCFFEGQVTLEPQAPQAESKTPLFAPDQWLQICPLADL